MRPRLIQCPAVSLGRTSGQTQIHLLWPKEIRYLGKTTPGVNGQLLCWPCISTGPCSRFISMGPSQNSALHYSNTNKSWQKLRFSLRAGWMRDWPWVNKQSNLGMTAQTVKWTIQIGTGDASNQNQLSFQWGEELGQLWIAGQINYLKSGEIRHLNRMSYKGDKIRMFSLCRNWHLTKKNGSCLQTLVQS